jgi:hypothetical protein
MLTGPVSPLSFTGAPVFLSVYTSFADFRNDNGFDGEVGGRVDPFAKLPATPDDFPF